MVQFDGGSSVDPDGEIVTFAWEFGDGSTSDQVAPSHTYTDPGTYTATLTVTDDRGATGVDTVQIEVRAPNVPPVAVIGATPTSGRAPLQVSFTGSGSSDPDGEIVAYAWDFGDGGTSAVANPSHTYSAVGTYTATLTVTDDDGATDTASRSINVTGVPAPTGLSQPFRDCGGFFATTCDIRVAWNAVPQVDLYEVEFDTANIACPGSNQVHRTTQTQFSTNVCKSIVANAYANVFWKVRARDSVTGQWGPWSARIQVNN